MRPITEIERDLEIARQEYAMNIEVRGPNNYDSWAANVEVEELELELGRL